MGRYKYIKIAVFEFCRITKCRFLELAIVVASAQSIDQQANRIYVIGVNVGSCGFQPSLANASLTAVFGSYLCGISNAMKVSTHTMS